VVEWVRWGGGVAGVLIFRGQLSSLISAYPQKNAKESIRTRNSAFKGLVICGRATLHVKALWYTLRQ